MRVRELVRLQDSDTSVQLWSTLEKTLGPRRPIRSIYEISDLEKFGGVSPNQQVDVGIIVEWRDLAGYLFLSVAISGVGTSRLSRGMLLHSISVGRSSAVPFNARIVVPVTRRPYFISLLLLHVER